MEVKCLKCEDVIKGNKLGTTIYCDCGKCSIKTTKFDTQVCGNPDYMEILGSSKNSKAIQQQATSDIKTNFDYVKSLDSYDLALFLINDLETITANFSDKLSSILVWLSQDYEKEDMDMKV